MNRAIRARTTAAIAGKMYCKCISTGRIVLTRQRFTSLFLERYQHGDVEAGMSEQYKWFTQNDFICLSNVLRDCVIVVVSSQDPHCPLD